MPFRHLIQTVDPEAVLPEGRIGLDELAIYVLQRRGVNKLPPGHQSRRRLESVDEGDEVPQPPADEGAEEMNVEEFLGEVLEEVSGWLPGRRALDLGQDCIAALRQKEVILPPSEEPTVEEALEEIAAPPPRRFGFVLHRLGLIGVTMMGALAAIRRT